jgi:hypothetical protein
MTAGYPTRRRYWPTLAVISALGLSLAGCASRPPAPSADPGPAAMVALPSSPSTPSPSTMLTFLEVGGTRTMRWSASTSADGQRRIVREVLTPAQDGAMPDVEDRTMITTRVAPSGPESLVAVRVESQKAETQFEPALVQPWLGMPRDAGPRVDRAVARVLRDGSSDPLMGEAEQTIEPINPAPDAPPGSVAWRVDLTIRLGPSVTRTRTERTIAPSPSSPSGELWAEARRLTVHVLGVRIEKQQDAWRRDASPGY